MSVFKAYKHLLEEAYTGPTHDKQARLDYERKEREMEQNSIRDIGDNDEAYLEELMGVTEFNGTQSMFETLKPQLDKLIVDIKKGGEIENVDLFFRKYKAILWFLVQESSLQPMNKAKLFEVLSHVRTAMELYDSLLNLKVGTGGYDYKAKIR